LIEWLEKKRESEPPGRRQTGLGRVQKYSKEPLKGRGARAKGRDPTARKERTYLIWVVVDELQKRGGGKNRVNHYPNDP